MRKFGAAFGETFVEGRRRRQRWVARAVGFYVVGGGLMILLMGRLAQLQLVEGRANRARAEGNRVTIEVMRAPRGAIVDRQGEALVRNVPVYKKCQMPNAKCQIVTREEAEKLKREGEEVVEDVGREYIYGRALGHILGYVGEISPQELEEARQKCRTGQGRCDYSLGDWMGKMGVERVYEQLLKGVDGGSVVERGAGGEVLRKLAVRQPQSGGEVKLTIDLGLQRKVVEAMGDRAGAVVVSDPRNGEILALASGPGFEPNIFSNQKTENSEQRTEILESEEKPLFNRALAGLYPPGSVFKIVTAVAGLEEREIDAFTEIEDTGEIKIGEFRYGNWYFDQYGKTEGLLDLVRGLKRSNDIFFYKVGEKVGAEKIAGWAEKMGLGKLVELGVGGEAEGVVPSPAWKEKQKGERWFLGNTYHLAIGQGDLQVTPLQIHQMVSVIAAGGRLCRPTIIQNSPVPVGTGQAEFRIQNCEDVGISEQTLKLVTKGMVEACKPGGTAFPLFNFSAREASPSGEIDDKDRVACKTGTAQFNDPLDRTHAWFVVFGPSRDPEVVVTVMLEAGGEGSYQAAPVAKEILGYWFHER